MLGMNSQRTGLRVASVIFGIIAIAHIARLFAHSKVIIGHFAVPMQLSWVALIVGALLCIWMWRLSATR
jgi:uncharacterized membrane protein YecN with MAPEG domain